MVADGGCVGHGLNGGAEWLGAHTRWLTAVRWYSGVVETGGLMAVAACAEGDDGGVALWARRRRGLGVRSCDREGKRWWVYFSVLLVKSSALI